MPRCPACHLRLPLASVLWNSGSIDCPHCRSELEIWVIFVTMFVTLSVMYAMRDFLAFLGVSRFIRVVLACVAGALAGILIICFVPNVYRLKPSLSLLTTLNLREDERSSLPDQTGTPGRP
jgi:hypothetical protein